MKMTQSWFILLITAVVVCARSASTTVSGTCASIGYSTKCCPPSDENGCQADDGNCYCGADCHVMGDCCEDVHCPSQPRTCSDIGITQCCEDASGNKLCDVLFRDSDNNHCSCNVSCHRRKDCCPDAHRFCVPETCNDAGKYPGCCKRMDASLCYVPGGNCYCDPLCTLYNDCCDDASEHLSQCSSAPTITFVGRVPRMLLFAASIYELADASHLSKSRLQAVQSYKTFKDRDLRIHRQRPNTNYAYQEASVTHIKRVNMNPREFRPHVSRRPST